ncbi:uncharacterized protein LOC121384007 [Gigantopelta aegis]|uniref:uncharacterized protein LOC121384007 n=1 Tax=Gigantopelta aegis TaxID=1735272 RepID=UPI001B88B3C6|nr:uncharacterized protein LOC121384007 [Gigantopelta aegis]
MTMLRKPDLSLESKPQTLLSVNEDIRPRANTDPTNGKDGSVQLPEIMVEDFSVEGHSAVADVSDGGLIIPQQRQRANTCPEELFRKRRNRPATPPPCRKSGPNKFVFKTPPKREPISFVVHKLGKLSEDSESSSFSCRGLSKSFSGDRYRTEANRRKSMPDSRISKNCSFRAKPSLNDSIQFPREETPVSISEKQTSVLPETLVCESAGLKSLGLEERGTCHSKECRYTGSLSRVIDATQLQAY